MSREMACILAGGKSSRMGRDKAEVELFGKRLIDHVVERLRTQVEQIVLSAPHDYRTGLSVVEDCEERFGGPVLGILSVVEWLLSQPALPDHLTIVSVDLPWIPLDLVERFREQEGSSYAFDGKRAHPTCARLSFKALAAWQEQVRLRLPASAKGPSLMALLEGLGARPYLFPEAPWLLSVNTEAELEILEKSVGHSFEF